MFRLTRKLLRTELLLFVWLVDISQSSLLLVAQFVSCHSLVQWSDLLSYNQNRGTLKWPEEWLWVWHLFCLSLWQKSRRVQGLPLSSVQTHIRICATASVPIVTPVVVGRAVVSDAATYLNSPSSLHLSAFNQEKIKCKKKWVLLKIISL